MKAMRHSGRLAQQVQETRAFDTSLLLTGGGGAQWRSCHVSFPGRHGDCHSDRRLEGPSLPPWYRAEQPPSHVRPRHPPWPIPEQTPSLNTGLSFCHRRPGSDTCPVRTQIPSASTQGSNGRPPDGWTDGRTDGRMGGWVWREGRKVGWTDRGTHREMRGE